MSDAPAPRRIIIADDDVPIRQIVVKMLERSGFDVCEACNGAEALALASKAIPHLFILDITMPEMDGLETLRHIKADPRLATTPVLFLSARSEVEDRVAGLDLGATDFVAKPFNVNELLARVRSSLRAGRHTQNRKLRMLEDELDLAGKIQQSLLPRKAPEVRGLQVYGEMLPMRKVGGDYFDFVEGDEAQIVCVGDVSGKGIPAALVMVMARTFLNHWDVNVADTRMSLLALNRLLYDNTDSGIFMSMVLFKWDLREQRLYFTGAGHEHLLVYRASTQSIDVLKTGGQVLGLRPNILDHLREQELPLGAGDVLLLYTDGVTEAMSPRGEEFGIERLRQAFLSTANRDAEDIVEHVFGELSAFTSGRRQDDDITLVALRRVETP